MKAFTGGIWRFLRLRDAGIAGMLPDPLMRKPRNDILKRKALTA
jgi:hypothetical protein